MHQASEKLAHDFKVNALVYYSVLYCNTNKAVPVAVDYRSEVLLPISRTISSTVYVDKRWQILGI